MKTKTIKLSDGWAPVNITGHENQAAWDAATRFRVEQVTDSIEYRTGDLLERSVVAQLCDSAHWKVTIVPKPNAR